MVVSPAAVLATIFFKNPSSMVILFLTIRVRSVRSQRNCAVHRYYQISKCQKNPPLSRIRTYLAPTSGSSSPKLSSNRRDYLILCYIRSPPFLDLARVSFTQIFSFPKPPRTHSIVAFKSRKLETHIRLYDLLKSSLLVFRDPTTSLFLASRSTELHKFQTSHLTVRRPGPPDSVKTYFI